MRRYLKAGEVTRKGDICHCADGRELEVFPSTDEMTSPGLVVRQGHEIYERLVPEDKPYRLELELKGLSPTCRDALIKAMHEALDRMYRDISSDLSDYWGPIEKDDSPARKEMEGWKDALSELSTQIVTQKKAWPRG